MKKYKLVMIGQGKTAYYHAYSRFLFFFWQSIEHDVFEAWDWTEPKKYYTKQEAVDAMRKDAGRDVEYLRGTFGINRYTAWFR